MQWVDIGGYASTYVMHCALCPVQDLQVVVFKITTPNFGFSTGSWVGRSIFLDFLKKYFFRKKIIKKRVFWSILCPNKVNIWYYWVRITKFGTVVTGVSVINNIEYWEMCKYPPRPPVVGGGGCHTGNPQNWGWPRFLIFCLYQWYTLIVEVCSCSDHPPPRNTPKGGNW